MKFILPSSILLVAVSLFCLNAPKGASSVEANTQRDMAVLSTAMRSFYYTYGKFPMGDNSSIIEQLKKTEGFNIDPARLDKNGNMLDLFGAPYIFLFSHNGDCMIASIGRTLHEKNSGLIEIYPVKLAHLHDIKYIEWLLQNDGKPYRPQDE